MGIVGISRWGDKLAKERRCGTCKYWEDTEETIGLINERLGRCNFADGYIPFLGLQGVFVVEGNVMIVLTGKK